jgi:hypothetical protein
MILHKKTSLSFWPLTQVGKHEKSFSSAMYFLVNSLSIIHGPCL